MIDIYKIYDFINENKGKNIYVDEVLYWYLERLCDKGQIIVIEENGGIKAIAAYFLCREQDLQYVESWNWSLFLNYSEGDIMYVSLVVSKGFIYTRKIYKALVEISKALNVFKAYTVLLGQLKVLVEIDRCTNKLIFKRRILCLENPIAVH